MGSYPTTEELVKRASEARNENKLYWCKINERTLFWDGLYYVDGDPVGRTRLGKEVYE